MKGKSHVIKNERIKLRPMEIEDGKHLYKWKNSEEVFKYLGGGFKPQSFFELNEFLPQLCRITEKNYRFIILNAKNNLPIGLIGLYDINNIHRNCEVGLYIGDEDYLNMGIGTDALKLIEDYAKNYLNIRKISLSVVSENIGAVSFWEKNSYKLVGVKKEDRYIQGKYCDVEIREKFL